MILKIIVRTSGKIPATYASMLGKYVQIFAILKRNGSLRVIVMLDTCEEAKVD